MATVTELQETIQKLWHCSETLLANQEIRQHHRLVESWRDRAIALDTQLGSRSLLKIALLGPTGCGKSSLINSILGMELLPTSAGMPCTAFPISVCSSSESRGFRLVLNLQSEEEWNGELRILQDSLSRNSHLPDETQDAQALMKAAIDRVKAVYDLSPSIAPADIKFDSLVLPEAIRTQLTKGQQTAFFDTEDQVLAALETWTTGADSMWPLVTDALVEGPFVTMPPGTELVDLPGLNDPNEARIEVTRQYLASSPCLWLVFDSVRGLTADLRNSLIEFGLLDDIMLSGQVNALALIATKIDTVPASQRSRFGLPTSASRTDLYLAHADRTKKNLREQFRDTVGQTGSAHRAAWSSRPDVLERIVESARIFAVSSALEFDASDPAHEVSGMSELQLFIADLDATVGAERQRLEVSSRVESLRREMRRFLDQVVRGAKATQSTLDSLIEAQRLVVSRIGDAVNSSLADWSQAAQRTNSSIQTAGRSARNETQRVVSGWGGIHWSTLRAIVSRNGYFTSPSTGHTYDFNHDLSRPFIAQIGLTWEQLLTSEVRRILDLAEQRISSTGSSSLAGGMLAIKLVTGEESDLSWVNDSIKSQVRAALSDVSRQIALRRSSVPVLVSNRIVSAMAPAYASCRQESGSGMKARMIDILRARAITVSGETYSQIAFQLEQGVSDVGQIITDTFTSLQGSALQQWESVIRLASDQALSAGQRARLETVIQQYLE